MATLRPALLRQCCLLALSLPLARTYLIRAPECGLSSPSLAAPTLRDGFPSLRPSKVRRARGQSLCPPARRTRGQWRVNAPGVAMAFDPLLSGVSTVASALFFFAYETRPSGVLAVDEEADVVAKTSTIPNAGLGLFAARDLEAGTVLGTYPGRVWRADAWLRYKGLEPSDFLLDSAQKEKVQRERQRKAEAYTWKLGKEIDSEDDGDDPGAPPATQTYTATVVIDPTSATGELSDAVPWVLDTFATLPTLLCRINEPGQGGDVNVVAEEAEDSVTFILERDVKVGEELFMDYGPYYDRSGYSGYSASAAAGGEDAVRDAVRKTLDAILQQKQEEESGSPKWGYSDFLLAVEAGQIASVQFSNDGRRIVATDTAGNLVELEDIPSDSNILDILAKRKVDVSVLPE